MITLIATPIGRTDEITSRALQLLTNADVVICESTKETSKLLKVHGIKAKRYELLNEHSTKEDLAALVELCKTLNCVLVSDCGTPSFCDPGFQLVRECRKLKISVQTALGPSSLMGLISLSSRRIEQFLFRGFLPAENEAREKSLLELKKNKSAIVLMDTPYRLRKTIDDCAQHFRSRTMLLAMDLSQETELILEASPLEIRQNLDRDKAEFMILLYAEET